MLHQQLIFNWRSNFIIARSNAIISFCDVATFYQWFWFFSCYHSTLFINKRNASSFSSTTWSAVDIYTLTAIYWSHWWKVFSENPSFSATVSFYDILWCFSLLLSLSISHLSLKIWCLSFITELAFSACTSVPSLLPFCNINLIVYFMIPALNYESISQSEALCKFIESLKVQPSVIHDTKNTSKFHKSKSKYFVEFYLLSAQPQANVAPESKCCNLGRIVTEKP